jgi:hypothetical protein
VEEVVRRVKCRASGRESAVMVGRQGQACCATLSAWPGFSHTVVWDEFEPHRVCDRWRVSVAHVVRFCSLSSLSFSPTYFAITDTLRMRGALSR